MAAVNQEVTWDVVHFFGVFVWFLMVFWVGEKHQKAFLLGFFEFFFFQVSWDPIWFGLFMVFLVAGEEKECFWVVFFSFSKWPGLVWFGVF